ncbi:excinuclease ABC subunit UvrC [Desulfurella sp.]|uniref:excinuclease ABC subunit UvrC n=1 Tax=Desulfurella sp. TaxID=1962857 RepID=UPI003D0FD6C7
MNGVEIFLDKTLLRQIPKLSGVYKIYSSQNELLYIGKAKNLRNRLASYLRKNIDPYKQKMIQEAHSVEIIVTKNEEEALLLESNLIKEQRPPYNIVFRDDKSYPYLRITYSENFPRVTYSRRIKNKDDFYFGPFPSAESLHMLIKVIKDSYKIIQKDDKSCQKTNQKPCIYYQMKKCFAPCAQMVSKQDYLKLIDEINLLLSKNHDVLKNKIIEQIKKYANEEQFEKAIELRDSLEAINILKEKPIVTDTKAQILDCFAFLEKDDITCVYVLNVRLGKVIAGRSFFFNKSFDLESKQEFVIQYYLQGELLPKKILISEPLELSNSIFEKKVEIVYPKKGENLKILELAKNNAKEQLDLHLSKLKANLEVFKQIKLLLGLEKIPYYFDVFDIAHISFEYVVAGVVRFDISGFNKSYYRKYKLESKFEYESMKEAICRHINLIKNSKLILPDVVILDGGPIQLKAASFCGVKAIAIAKEKIDHKTIRSLYDVEDSVYLEHGKVETDKKVLNFLQKLRDEAHRFANTYHRNLRNKTTIASALDRIEFIGPKRKKELFEKFGSIENIKNAPLKDIVSIKGISESIAQMIKEKLKDF